MLHLAQLNLRASPTCFNVLLQLITISSVSADVLLLQDPPSSLQAGNPPIGWSLFSPSVYTDEVKAVVLVRSHLRSQAILSTSGRISAALLPSPGNDFVVVSCYVQPVTGAGLTDLHAFLFQLPPTCAHILFAADSNGCNPLWSPPHVSTNLLGSKIQEILYTHALHINNLPNSFPTFLDSNESGHWLDITASSISLQCTNWRVHQDCIHPTDHCLITYDIPNLTPESTQPRRLWHLADWDLIRTSVSQQLKANLPLPLTCPACPSELDLLATQFERACAAALIHVPCRTVFSGAKPWWSPDLQHLKDNLNRLQRMAHRCWVRTNTSAPLAIRDDLRHAKQLYRLAIQSAKRQQWRTFTTYRTPTQIWQAYHKVTRPRAQASLDYIYDAQGKCLTHPTEVAACLAGKFFPAPIPTPPDDPSSQLEPPHEPHLSSSTQPTHPITALEIHWALQRTRPFAAPGSDKIPAALYIKLFKVILPYLLVIFNALITLSHLPGPWKHSIVVSVPKCSMHGNCLANFRPISLIQTVSKCLEAILTRRLRDWTSSYAPLHRHQFGFLPGKSTDAALHHLHSTLAEGMSVGAGGVLVALDIRAAFDSVRHHLLLNVLIRKGVPRYLCLWIKAFLTGRTASLFVAGTTCIYPINMGVPQGSPMLPQLFLHFINEALCLPDLHSMIAYTDDLSIASTSPLPQALSTFQTQLDALHAWCLSMHLRLSVQKCAYMIIPPTTRRSEAPPQQSLAIDGLPLQKVATLKILGITFDEQLSFFSHVKTVVGRCQTLLRQPHKFCGQFWGYSPAIIHHLIRATFFPVLTYGSICWSPAIKQAELSVITKAVRAAEIMITGCLRTTSTEAVSVLAGILPASQILQMAFYRSYLCLKSLGQIRDTPPGSRLQSHRRMLNGRICRHIGLRDHSIPVLELSHTLHAPWASPIGQHVSLPTRTHISLTDANTLGFSYTQMFLYLVCARDSLHFGGGWYVSWGAMRATKQYCTFGLQDDSTLLLHALWKGLQHILTWMDATTTPPSILHIFGGDSALFRLLCTRKPSVDLVHNIRRIFWQLQTFRITFLAQHSSWSATEVSTLQRKLVTSLTYNRSTLDVEHVSLGWDPSRVMLVLEQVLCQVFTQQVSQVDRGQDAKEIGLVFSLDSLLTSKLNRTHATLVCQFLSGHYPCAAYRKRFHIKDAPTDTRCICGAPFESRWHIIRWCPALTTTRHNAWGSDIPTSLQAVTRDLKKLGYFLSGLKQ